MASLLSRLANGANRFAGELLNPTNALGQIGAYLGAASGSPLGESTLAAMAAGRRKRDDDLEREYRIAQIEALRAPKAPSNDYERIVSRLGQNAGDSYLSALAAGPPMAIDTVDNQGNTIRQFVPRSQLFGKNASGAPQSGITFTPIDGGARPAAASRPFRKSS